MAVYDVSPLKSHVYTGLGDYEFDFAVLLTTDVSCYVVLPDGSTSVLVRNTDYSVTLAVSPIVGGTVSIDVDSNPTAIKLVILRDMPYTQTVNWQNGGPLNQRLITWAFDKLTMLVQQLRADAADTTASSTWRGMWLPGAVYSFKDVIISPNGNWYYCIEGHTAGVFVDDLASGYWLLALDAAASNRGAVDAQLFGAGPGVLNNYTAIQEALTFVDSNGGGEVFLPAGNDIYQVTLSAVPLYIGSHTTLNLNGNTLHRTDTGNFPTIKNAGNGTTTDYEVYVINGLITGVGANGTVTDQGSAVTLYNVDGYGIKNLRTNNTTGDGITLRTAENGVLRDIRIGNFGRNGFSPDSGSGVIDNLVVEGTAFTGANPGLGIDVETDAIDEFGDWVFDGVKAGRILLIDQHTATDDKFGIKVKFSNCTFGPDNLPFYIKSTNRTKNAEVVLDSTNTLIVSSGYGAAAFTSWNVGGFSLDEPVMKHDETITPDAQTSGILIAGVVDAANIIFPKIASTFSHTLWCYSTNRINNSIIKISDFQNVYFGGASNILCGDKAGTITLDGADTLSNTIVISEAFTKAAGISGTASWNNQHVGSARGFEAKSFYSMEYSVPAGASHDLLVPLPAHGAGRGVLVSAGFSSAGLATEWGNLLQFVIYGATAQSARTAIDSAGVGVTVSIVSVTTTYMIVRVAHASAGVLSVAVLG